MRYAITWLTSPASIAPRRARRARPPGECSPRSLATTNGDIVCSVDSASAIRLLVGDVMGHGPRAACTSAEVMRAFRDLATRPGPGQAIAAGLDEFLTARPRSSEINEECVPALFISGPWDAGGEAQIVTCGPPAPLRPRAPPGTATVLAASALAPPLGLLDL